MALAYYQKHLLSFVAFLLLGNLHVEHLMGKEVVPVGVVLDLNSTVGGVAERCMSMALSDFYAVYDDYNTRIALLTRDSGNDVIAAASAALDLMKNEEVHAIIGPQSSAQAKFVIELGRKAQVPIISFSATSPSLSPAQNPFFIRTALDDSAQVKAIAAIVKAYDWREIVLIYEDTDYGNGLIPYWMDAFEKIETRMPYRSAIPPFSNNSEIAKEIKKLNETNCNSPLKLSVLDYFPSAITSLSSLPSSGITRIDYLFRKSRILFFTDSCKIMSLPRPHLAFLKPKLPLYVVDSHRTPPRTFLRRMFVTNNERRTGYPVDGITFYL